MFLDLEFAPVKPHSLVSLECLVPATRIVGWARGLQSAVTGMRWPGAGRQGELSGGDWRYRVRFSGLAAVLALIAGCAEQAAPPVPAATFISWPPGVSTFGELQHMAEQGDVQAMFLAGAALDSGFAGGRDVTGAAKWYRAAAQAGSTDAARRLDTLATQDEITAQDEVEADRWYRQPAEAGDPVAMFRFGRALEMPYGLDRNPVEAVRWYRRAAEAGNADAMVALGRSLADGRGVVRDDDEAIRWFKLAVSAGNPAGKTWMHEMFGRRVERADDADTLKKP